MLASYISNHEEANTFHSLVNKYLGKQWFKQTFDHQKPIFAIGIYRCQHMK
jgi:hypothetical protein